MKNKPKEYRLEDDLLVKSRPGFRSKRWTRLRLAAPAFARCEVCGAVLLNPASILIHQGKVCQKQISKK